MISHLSSWKLHGTTIRMSPSRIQTFFFILPLIRPILLTPSKHRTLIWFAPIISSAQANISRFLFWGSRTLMISSGPAPLFCFLSVSTSSPFALLRSMLQVKKTLLLQLYRINPDTGPQFPLSGRNTRTVGFPAFPAMNNIRY